MKKVVVIGGGSGLATLLRGLRDYPIDITAIVAMTDDGASSGRLRKDLGLLPPGDIRKCIAALSENETALVDLFQYRFKRSSGLTGHSLGNLIISAMMDITGNFEYAIEEISKLLNIKGKVLPSTLEDVNLTGCFDDGKCVVGESKITEYGYTHRITKLLLNKPAITNPKALEAIHNADVIFIGPGSLFTSVIANFLQKDLLLAFDKSKAFKVYICNVSTERGETDTFTAGDHLRALSDYSVNPDAILLNNYNFPSGSGDGYVFPVDPDLKGIKALKIEADLVDVENPLYHDQSKLANVTWEIIGKHKLLAKK